MTGNGGMRPAGRRRRALALLGLLCALLLPGQASALSGSILLDCHVQAGGETLPLSGDTFAIVQIADITVEGQGGAGDLTYQTRPVLPALPATGRPLPRDRQEKALQLEAYAKEKKLFTAAKTTDAKGPSRLYGTIHRPISGEPRAGGPGQWRLFDPTHPGGYPHPVVGEMVLCPQRGPQVGAKHPPGPGAGPHAGRFFRKRSFRPDPHAGQTG